jgi:hypothetical protein
MAAAFWLNDGDWLGPFTQPELVEHLADAGYQGEAFTMADCPTLVVLGPDLGCMFVESLMSVDGEHLYKCREVAA